MSKIQSQLDHAALKPLLDQLCKLIDEHGSRHATVRRFVNEQSKVPLFRELAIAAIVARERDPEEES